MLNAVFKDEGNGVHERFDRDRNTWSKWITKKLGSGFRVAVVGEQMAFIGGGGDYYYGIDVEVYNFITRNWTRGPKMNTARYVYFFIALYSTPPRAVLQFIFHSLRKVELR